MAQTHTDTNVNQLIINKLNKQEYDNLSQVSSTELYLVEEQVDSVVTQGSTNPVQSDAVYDAIQDIGGNINDGTTIFAKNQGIIGTTSANQSANQTINIPNDVEMIYLTHSKALSVQTTDAYYDTNCNYLVEEDPATWTDPNPQHRITTDGHYYDLLTDNIYQVDNYETTEVTSNVTIQGDTNKLYCGVDTNILYRYDGSNFVALTSEGKTYALSSNNENIRLTDSDGQTQDLSLNTLINGLSTGNSDPHDDDYIVAQYARGGTTTTTYHRRPLSKFWNWIKSKLGAETLTVHTLKISGGRVQGSGDDEGIVIAPCSNSYAALTLAAGGDPKTASGKYHSTFYLQASETYDMFWRASVNGSNYDIQHPKKSGTIALTSDIPTVWTGTLAQYNAISPKNASTIYLISD